MFIALLALVGALQTQAPAPHVQVAAFRPATPVALPAPPPPRPTVETVEAAVVEAEPEPEAEPVVEEPRTRQVCRYVEVTGQRFPVRRCRTVVAPDER